MDTGFLNADELKQIAVHPLAELVPPSAHVSVRDAIQNPVLLLDDKLVDGRGRVREARRLGLPCPYVRIHASYDDHPALVVARAMTARVPKPETYERAVVCARLVRAILLRPDWLDRYDLGMATRLKKRKNLDVILDACDVSLRSYDRAHMILRDPMVEGAVLAGIVPLKTAERLVNVESKKLRHRLVQMPADERLIALDRYFTRAGERHADSQPALDGIESVRRPRATGD
ncbi:hypothetical protein [Paraburkholderia sp. EG304]|uniref:hypothetical protein n=1 Tax=Paraburkholderia sp. EG304 TaxID=3237015 RepID=UPI00397D5B32